MNAQTEPRLVLSIKGRDVYLIDRRKSKSGAKALAARELASGKWHRVNVSATITSWSVYGVILKDAE